MLGLSQIVFAVLLALAVGLFIRQAKRIKRNIMLGRNQSINDYPKQRWKNVLLLAFGQKKMFANKPVAFLHLLVYVGFVVINAEILEIVLDGCLGTHRLFAPLLGDAYAWLINLFELLALGVIVACVIFLIRRNWLKVKRLASRDLDGFPRSDANFILLAEIVLMLFFLTMNGADTLLQERGFGVYAQHVTGSFWLSGTLRLLLHHLTNEMLVIVAQACWWLHIIGILTFLNYLSYSKHLHIILAFPNAYFSRLGVLGAMQNMPEIQNEVLYSMRPELAPPVSAEVIEHQHFGAKDVQDLSWKNLLDSYSCSECGRCTAACPANITGKVLSPRAVMMHTRDRLEEVGSNIDANNAFVSDGKALLRDYISEEAIRACTTCNACVAACPISISPLDIILQLRRYLIMEESNAPQEWNAAFNNIENNFAPWQFSPNDRANWREEDSPL